MHRQRAAPVALRREGLEYSRVAAVTAPVLHATNFGHRAGYATKHELDVSQQIPQKEEDHDALVPNFRRSSTIVQQDPAGVQNPESQHEVHEEQRSHQPEAAESTARSSVLVQDPRGVAVVAVAPLPPPSTSPELDTATIPEHVAETRADPSKTFEQGSQRTSSTSAFKLQAAAARAAAATAKETAATAKETAATATAQVTAAETALAEEAGQLEAYRAEVDTLRTEVSWLKREEAQESKKASMFLQEFAAEQSSFSLTQALFTEEKCLFQEAKYGQDEAKEELHRAERAFRVETEALNHVESMLADHMARSAGSIQDLQNRLDEANSSMAQRSLENLARQNEIQVAVQHQLGGAREAQAEATSELYQAKSSFEARSKSLLDEVADAQGRTQKMELRHMAAEKEIAESNAAREKAEYAASAAKADRAALLLDLTEVVALRSGLEEEVHFERKRRDEAERHSTSEVLRHAVLMQEAQVARSITEDAQREVMQERMYRDGDLAEFATELRKRREENDVLRRALESARIRVELLHGPDALTNCFASVGDGLESMLAAPLLLEPSVGKGLASEMPQYSSAGTAKTMPNNSATGALGKECAFETSDDDLFAAIGTKDVLADLPPLPNDDTFAELS